VPNSSFNVSDSVDRDRRIGRRTVRGILPARLLIALALVLGTGGVARAGDCYWKAASTANFNASTSNWSCGAIPSSSDRVHFDTAGGGTNTSCIVTASTSFRDFDIGSYTGTITINAAVVVSVGGNVAFTSSVPSALAGTGTVTLTGSSGGTSLQSGSAAFPALTVNASGSTYTLQDALSVSGALTMSNGTLTSGAKAVQAGSVSLGGGTFNASSGTTQVAGSFSKTGGTFSANGGTVKLIGSGSLQSGGASFNALTVAASGTYTLQDNLTATGAFTVSSGTLTAGSNAVGSSTPRAEPRRWPARSATPGGPSMPTAGR
jgi:hypothetical protein